MRETVIKSLNSDILEEFGFTFDGYYWVRPNTKVKLIASDTAGTYLVHVDDLPLNELTPPPVTNNSDLLRLILSAMEMSTGPAIKELVESTEVFDPNMIECELAKYLIFKNPNIKIDVTFDPLKGFGTSPGNRYTHTLFVGNESKFKITYLTEDDQVGECIDYIAVDCMSYGYAQEVVVSSKIARVEIWNTRTEKFEPFFGISAYDLM